MLYSRKKGSDATSESKCIDTISSMLLGTSDPVAPTIARYTVTVVSTLFTMVAGLSNLELMFLCCS